MSPRKPLSRRKFLETLALASASVPLAACGAFRPTGIERSGSSSFSSLLNPFTTESTIPAAKGSNVLFLVVDDLNDWISPLGGYYGKVNTPNFDRLAKRGVTFKNAYCAIPWCLPSRASTLTGLSPATTVFYGNRADGDMSRFPALANAETIPAYFMRKGYNVLGGGKVFHGDYSYGPNSTTAWRTCNQEKQFNVYKTFDNETRPALANPQRPASGLNVQISQFDWAPLPDAGEADMPDYKLAQWGAAQLKQPSKKPLFLALGIYRPHMPWYAPQKYFDMYPIDGIQIPAYLKNNTNATLPAFAKTFAEYTGDQALIENSGNADLNWRKAVQGYLASISFADRCLGIILDALDASPYAKNTTIVLWSDNGFQLGEQRAWRKFRLWEKSARVPLFVSVPGGAGAGAVVSKPVSLLDIYPTLTDLAANEIPPALEGNSLVPLIANPKAAWSYAALTSYSQNYDGTQLHRSVRTENYRYIQYYDGSEELYDHRNDPNELTNLLSGAAANSNARQVANTLQAMLPVKFGREVQPPFRDGV